VKQKSGLRLAAQKLCAACALFLLCSKSPLSTECLLVQDRRCCAHRAGHGGNTSVGSDPIVATSTNNSEVLIISFCKSASVHIQIRKYQNKFSCFHVKTSSEPSLATYETGAME
jgi:hypothetical protein